MIATYDFDFVFVQELREEVVRFLWNYAVSKVCVQEICAVCVSTAHLSGFALVGGLFP